MITDSATLHPAPQADPTAPAEPSLATRAARGAAWVFTGKLIERLLNLAKLLILARLLSPEDFGLFGILMLAIAAIETFSQTGFTTALIQRKDDAEGYLDTAWTVQLIRGFVLGGLLFAAAPIITSFFAESRALPLLRVMCVLPVLTGLRNIGILYFQKNLQFKKQMAYSLLATGVAAAVGILAAYHLRSAWALLWSALAGNATACLLSYLLHPYRPHLSLKPSQARELFRYGRWVLISGILLLLIGKGDSLFVGTMLGTTALGLYQMAHNIANLPATHLTHAISVVAFPSYSQLQNDPQKVSAVYYRTLELAATLAIPVATALIILAPELVSVLLGTRWTPIIPLLRVLAVYGILRSLAGINSPLFQGTGTPVYDSVGLALKISLMAMIIYPLTTLFGLLGPALAILLPTAVSMTWGVYKALAITHIPFSRYCRAIASPAFASGVTAIFVHASQTLLSPPHAVLLAAIPIGTTSYILILHALGAIPTDLLEAPRRILRGASS